MYLAVVSCHTVAAAQEAVRGERGRKISTSQRVVRATNKPEKEKNNNSFKETFWEFWHLSHGQTYIVYYEYHQRSLQR